MTRNEYQSLVLSKRFDAAKDGSTIDIGSIVLDRPLKLKGRTGVRLVGSSIYYTGPTDVPVIEMESCTRCSVNLTGVLLNQVGGPSGNQLGIGLRITPDPASPIACVQNRISIDLISGFEVGIQIGTGNSKACDENYLHDMNINGCVDGLRIDGGNAQLQYVERLRMGGCLNACINVVRGGVHATNCSLSYSPVAVLIGEANPYVVLRDVYAEGGSQEMLYAATADNSNNPGTLQIHGGGSYCTADYQSTRATIKWLHNAPLTLIGHDLGGVLWVEEGSVYGRGLNLVSDPTRAPADWFRARGLASWDVAGQQQSAGGTWPKFALLEGSDA